MSSPPSPSLGFPPTFRLRRRRDFQRVMREGRRVSDRRLQLWGLPNGLAYSRFGLVVSRRHGSAVARNRLRRILREAFRLARPELPAGFDLACGPQPGAQLRLQGTMESLKRLARRLARGYETRHGQDGSRPTS